MAKKLKKKRKEQQRPKYLSYEDIVFPSHQSSLSQLHFNNTQENTKVDNTNVLSCDTSNQQKDVDEVTAQGGLKGNYGEWFEEIKRVCLNLVGKINVFKTRDRITKDHWKVTFRIF